MRKVTTTSETETTALATEFAKTLKSGTVIALFGDLGAGKTIFTKGVARQLGVTIPVTSPTFTILQEYALPNNVMLYHLDLYRISDYTAALAFGVDEYIDDPDGIILIEWAERIPELLPDNTVKITIRHIDDHTREIEIPENLDIE